jgi:hypothetical protein
MDTLCGVSYSRADDEEHVLKSNFERDSKKKQKEEQMSPQRIG